MKVMKSDFNIIDYQTHFLSLFVGGFAGLLLLLDLLGSLVQLLDEHGGLDIARVDRLRGSLLLLLRLRVSPDILLRMLLFLALLGLLFWSRDCCLDCLLFRFLLR